MVKPSGEGSSVGVYKLKGASVEEIREALAQALRFDDKVLVEERWFGRELTIAVLAEKSHLLLVVEHGEAPQGHHRGVHHLRQRILIVAALHYDDFLDLSHFRAAPNRASSSFSSSAGSTPRWLFIRRSTT